MDGAVTAELARPRGRARRAAARVVREPFTRRAWAEFGYVLIGVPLGAVGFAYTAASIYAGALLALTFFGLPLFAASSAGARALGAVSRGLAGRLLGLRVGSPPPLRRRPGFLGWIRSGLTDAVAWRARAYLVLKLPLAVISFYAAGITWAAGLLYLASPLGWHIEPGTVADHGVARHSFVNYGGFYFDTWPRIFLLAAQGVVLLLLAPWVVRATVAMDRWLIRGLLGPRTLPERVRELEQTRAQAVDDSAARLRRIERDLHDGTQAQLVAVAMKLGLAREKLGTAGEPDLRRARDLVDTAHSTAKDAIDELRDLVRGIHPPVLDSGLDAALATLAARSAIPVELIAHIPQRPSPAIETIAYFSAAELLTNVGKHSGARHATLEAIAVPGLLRIRVTDDGVGGAGGARGSGLAGLAERVRTVDGRVEISSPPGGPTVVTVELPSHA
jgi:signal transduction histidine kinase